MARPKSTKQSSDLNLIHSPVRQWFRTNWFPFCTLIVSILVGFGGLGYTIIKDVVAGRSNDRRFAAMETSLRVLTGTVAPQIYKSIDDSLRFAMTQDNSHVSQALAGVRASVRQLRDSNVQPDSKTLAQSSTILVQVSATHSEVPEVWQTAAELISFRSATGSPHLEQRSCFSRGVGGIELEANGEVSRTFKDCKINLNDVSGFDSETNVHYVGNLQGAVRTSLKLTNVTISLGPGPIIPFVRVVCSNCLLVPNFDNGLPSPPARRLSTELLEANNLQNFDLETGI